MFGHPDYDCHEALLFEQDTASGLRALIAIHDTTLGPAFGGCRMYPYASEQHATTDVLRLSRNSASIRMRERRGRALQGQVPTHARGTGSLQTLRWRKADSNSWSHFSARATLSLFATSRFEWDPCATYRSEPILPPIPSDRARRVVVVAVSAWPASGFRRARHHRLLWSWTRRRWSNAI
jgi:hypothetical protein